jgi:hypothetical protein
VDRAPRRVAVTSRSARADRSPAAIRSRPSARISRDVANERRRWPAAPGPKNAREPGTTATSWRSSSQPASSSESTPRRETSGKATKVPSGTAHRTPGMATSRATAWSRRRCRWATKRSSHSSPSS